MSESTASAWSPLKLKPFRALWLAALFSNIGTWMHEVGAAWLMTSLAPSPVMVALVQTATSLPVFLLGLPAGALADILDRRRYLIGLQVWLAGTAALLSLITLLGLITAGLLIALTLAMGMGTALMMPAWAALTPELVPRTELQPAIALNSMGLNVARAIGPALAGVIIAQVGPGVVFILNAVSFLGVVIVLLRWRREPSSSTLPVERFVSALRTGIRFARHAPALQATLIRGLGFFLFTSASWALLPLVARQELGGGPQTYGLLVACIGVGAVAGALILPRLRARMTADALIAGATVLYALTMLALALARQLWVLAPAMLLSGLAWIAVLSSLHTAAQMSLPNWVRSRGLAVFMMTFMGSMAGGGLAWGYFAESAGIATALAAAAAGAMLAVAVTWRWPLDAIAKADLTPAMHWPTPATAFDPEPDHGPVLVTTEYRIDPADRVAFVQAMREMRRMRRRNGAFSWGLFHDAAAPGRYIEYFLDESWLGHLRQHERVSIADWEIQQRARTFHRGEPPRVSHLLAEPVPARRTGPA